MAGIQRPNLEFALIDGMVDRYMKALLLLMLLLTSDLVMAEGRCPPGQSQSVTSDMASVGVRQFLAGMGKAALLSRAPQCRLANG